jgi:hypothetical protein
MSKVRQLSKEEKIKYDKLAKGATQERLTTFAMNDTGWYIACDVASGISYKGRTKESAMRGLGRLVNKLEGGVTA